MKFLKENIENNIEFYVSSEHKEGSNGFYGYMNVVHPTLGDFCVSMHINGNDIHTDGYPWDFLKEPDERLTSEQIEYVNSIKNNKKLKSLIRKGAWSFTNKDFE